MVVRGLRAAADPDRATDMAAYMRGRPFLGVPTPERRRIARPLVVAARPPSRSGGRRAGGPPVVPSRTGVPVRRLRPGPGRGRALGHGAAGRPAALRHGPLVVGHRRPAVAHAVGDLVATHPGLRAEMDRWIDDADRWVARVALLHQVGWKDRTDADRLFAFCRVPGHRHRVLHPQGRRLGPASYARTAPDAVAAFVREHPSCRDCPAGSRSGTSHPEGPTPPGDGAPGRRVAQASTGGAEAATRSRAQDRLSGPDMASVSGEGLLHGLLALDRAQDLHRDLVHGQFRHPRVAQRVHPDGFWVGSNMAYTSPVSATQFSPAPTAASVQSRPKEISSECRRRSSAS